MSAVTFFLKWFPFSEGIIRCSEFVDFDYKEQCDFSTVLTVVAQYPKILDFSKRFKEINRLNGDFLNYQGISRNEVPKEMVLLAMKLEIILKMWCFTEWTL